jgi:site-specific DNA-methyltransferase (adenine-specific)
MTNKVHLGDCMEGLKDKPDNYYDLAVVDPPYGIGFENMTNGGYYDGKKKKGRSNVIVNSPNYTKQKVEWDVKPDKEYFNQLFRVSKNQIIWGANHFELPPTKCIIFWDKQTGDFSFGDGEIAWCSIGGSIKKFTFRWSGFLQGDNGNYKEKRIHITQKPVAIYDWIFKNYAKEGMKILDTHVGSGSSSIAADKAGLWFEGWELDPDYHAAQEKRYNDFKKQLRFEF